MTTAPIKTIPAPTLEPVMIDVGGVARLLGISRRHAQQLDSSGRLGPMPRKLGRCTRWSVAEIRDWVQGGCVPRSKWIEQRGGATMSETSGLTHITAPVALFRLNVRSALELAILSLAASFDRDGLYASNGVLAKALSADRSNIVRTIKGLKDKGYITVQEDALSRVIRLSPSVRMTLGGSVKMTPPDSVTKTLGECHKDTTDSVKMTPPSEENSKENRKGTKKENPPISPKGEDGFDRFWRVYPKRVAKEAARKAFARIAPDDAMLDRMIAAVKTQRDTNQWTKDGGQYIPHPATWLNAHRWEDEVPAAKGPVVDADREIQVPFNSPTKEHYAIMDDLYGPDPTRDYTSQVSAYGEVIHA
ncbi:MAG: helix-turn-helix domain-containing protein [Phycisphaerales bacterium]